VGDVDLRGVSAFSDLIRIDIVGLPKSNGGYTMTNRLPTLAAAALLAISPAPFANVASAMPVANAIVSQNMAPADIEAVQWRGRGWGGGGWGLGAGLLGGAIVGGMLASPYYGRPYYPGGYYPAPGYAGAPPEDAVAYCMQRFKSYDPRSGTYLGYDGYRHPCP
jgi:hypothetical protein